jgi:cobalt-precorrin 5A hydrolase
LVITDRLVPAKKSEETYQQILHDKNVVLYRPGSLVAGMGCRRGVPWEELEELLATTFERHNLSSRSLGCIATAELKKDEPGILALADKYGVPLVCYDKDELNRMFNPLPAAQDATGSGLPAGTTRTERDSGRPIPSPRAYSLLGIWGVAEPAALLASGSDQLLAPRQNTSNATIAIARKPFSVHR